MDDKTRIATDPGTGTMPVGPGTQLSGIFELDEHIATGGMGEVFRGHNIETGDKVAIKIVLPEFSRDPTILALFRKEASILNHLSHDAIVRYHVFTVDPRIGRPYMAMEFVDGDALFDVLQRGPLRSGDVWQLCHRLATGLAAVHEAGAVHRDLSPDNVILPGGRVDRAKIIDFGIARSAHAGGETLIGGKFAGKYNFVSPEQLGLNGGVVSDKSDIYSLGLVLAAAVRGKPLEMSGSQLEIIEKRRAVPDLHDIEAEFRPIIEAMLQPDPADRPSSAELTMMIGVGSLKADAAAAGQRAGGPAGFVPHKPAQLPKAAPLPRPAVATPPTSAKPRSRTGLIATVSVLAVAAIAGGAYVLLPSGDAGDAARSDPTPAPQTTTLSPAPAPAPPAETVVAAPPPANEPTPDPSPQTAAEPSQATSEPPQTGTQAEVAAPEPPSETPAAPEATAAAPQPSETIAALPTPPPPAPAPEVDEAEAVSWVRDNGSAACFNAGVTVEGTSDVTLSGLGTGEGPLASLSTAFKERFGVEPRRRMALIEPAQCAALDFANADAADATGRPALELESTAVSATAPLAGTLTTQGAAGTYLYLVDHKGVVFNLTERIDTLSREARFSVPLALAAADKVAGIARPQLLVAVSGLGGIDSASFTRPASAADLFPQLRAQLQEKGRPVSAVVQQFTLGP